MAYKKTGNNTKGAGRKRYTIDWDFVIENLRAGVAGSTIAQMLGISADTLYDRTIEEHPEYPNFSSFSQAKRAEGLDILKKKQYELAKEGDRTMLVWLGKNYMGQKDKIDVDQNVKQETTIKIEW